MLTFDMIAKPMERAAASDPRISLRQENLKGPHGIPHEETLVFPPQGNRVYLTSICCMKAKPSQGWGPCLHTDMTHSWSSRARKSLRLPEPPGQDVMTRRVHPGKPPEAGATHGLAGSTSSLNPGVRRHPIKSFQRSF